MKPPITVLMPVYNAEKFLREAIDSILNQTFKDFEFLIINDASTDNSKEIIQSYKDPRIKYFENKKNLGVATTLNRGLRLAMGDYIARMDADDISLPNRLKTQFETITKDESLVVVATCFYLIDEKGNYLSTSKDEVLSEGIFYKLQFRNCIGHPTVMYKKSIILNEFNGYKIQEAEDYDLWLRVSKKYQLIKINSCLLKLRVSGSSLMGTINKKVNEQATLITKNNLELIIGREINTNTIELLRRNFMTTRSDSSLIFLKEDFHKALIILQEINNYIFNKHPKFIEESILKKIVSEKDNRLKHDLYLAMIYDVKFGFLIKHLFRYFFFLEERLSEKIDRMNHTISMKFHRL